MITTPSALSTIAGNSAVFGSNTEICRDVTFTFRWKQPVTIPGGSCFALKLPRDRFTYRLTASSNFGSVYLIDIPSKNELFYLVRASWNIAGNDNLGITLGSVRNPNEYTPGIEVTMIYWLSQVK